MDIYVLKSWNILKISVAYFFEQKQIKKKARKHNLKLEL